MRNFMLIVWLSVVMIVFTPKMSHAQETKDTSNNSNSHNISDALPITAKRHVQVLYFYYLPRCSACEMIEAYTEFTVDECFKEAVKNGTLAYRTIDTGKKENKHYNTKYRLLTKSVIISEVVDGKERRWKNCDKIWFLYKNEEKFTAYITKEINEYLN